MSDEIDKAPDIAAALGISRSEARMRIVMLPDDLKPIMLAVFDLAHYRQVGQVADDLRTAVAHELCDRVSRLPEVKAL